MRICACQNSVDLQLRVVIAFRIKDIYDLDSDGELSLPEIERMVIELYGTGNILNSMGKEVLEDINQFAEERGGGVLSLTSFSIYTMNHSMLLFPIFRIQRIIQKRVMGIKYWENVANSQAASTKANKFDPRHVQILLRTYKTGAAAAILTHTGDPNVALKQQFDEENNKEAKEKEHGEKSHDGDKAKYKYDKLKRAVDKINAANAAKKSTKKETVSIKSMSFISFIQNYLHLFTSSDYLLFLHKGESIRSKTVDMAAKAFIEAGRKARTSIAKSRLSQIPSKVRRLTNDIREQLVFNEIDLTSKQDININKLQSNIIAPSGPQKHGDLDLKGPATRVKEGQIQFTKSQKKKLRPKSAPSSQMNPKRGLLNHSRSTTFDHRRSSFKKNIRPRTPGSIVYVINEDGDFNRENNNNISKT